MDNENDLRLNLLSEQIIENSQFRPRIVTSNGNGSNVALTATGGGGVNSGGSESSVLIPMSSENGSSSTVGLTKPGYQQAIELVWRDLSYKVKAKSDQLFSNPFFQSETSYSTLINNLNGSIRNGQLTAIVGPSGAGKTTLIECLAGRRISGVTGDIVVKFNGLSKKSIKLSYYSQKDSLCDLLTVKESLLYASQLRNCIVSNRSKNMLFTGTDINSNTKQITNLSESLQPTSYHMMVVEKLIEELNLRKCYNTQLKNCSGGQRRRLSIALELIFSPSIFLLDEPTSGLDSLSSLQCIELLKKLATKPDRPMIVATSIHQPTAKIMSYFDHLYILSNTGQCIYNGPPENLLDKMSSIGLHCPQYHNPADFVVEVATGEFGLDCINYLADHFKSVCEKQGQQLIELDQSVKIKKLVQSTQKHSLYNQMMTTVVLTKRCFLQSFRDRKIYNTRFLIMAVTLFLVFILYFDHPIGELDGCVELPTRNTLTKLQNFELADTHNLYFANFGFLFYSVILMVFISILPTLLSFPLEVSVFVKENFNGWYSLQSYYIARTIADLPPMLIFPVIYSSSSFFLTSQVYNHYRFIAFNCILALVSFLAQGLGYLVSAYFVNDVTSSTVVGAVVNVPLFLFTGLLIKISAMPKFFQPITYISYFRLAFEALLVVIYGNGRCPSVKPLNYPYLKGEFGEEILDIYTCVEQFNSNTAENVTIFIQNYNNKFLHSLNQTSNSYALNAFGYNDDIIYFNVFLMFLIAFVLRFATYYILKAKISVR